MVDFDLVIMIAASWLIYFLLHSLLASLAVKSIVVRHYPSAMPWYRLGFNFIAIVGLIIPLWLTFSRASDYLYHWQGWSFWVANSLTVLALAGFAWSLMFYDGQEFLGLKQIKMKARSIEDQESFKLSPLHRYTRHPWYFLGLLLIWSREMNIYMLTSAVFMTLYFWVGSKLEEKKLLVYHGDQYKTYMQKVPGLIPLPWKFLTRVEAGRLINKSASGIRSN